MNRQRPHDSLQGLSQMQFANRRKNFEFVVSAPIKAALEFFTDEAYEKDLEHALSYIKPAELFGVIKKLSEETQKAIIPKCINKEGVLGEKFHQATPYLGRPTATSEKLLVEMEKHLSALTKFKTARYREEMRYSRETNEEQMDRLTRDTDNKL